MKNLLVVTIAFFSITASAKIVGESSFFPIAKNPAFTRLHPKVCVDHGHHNLSIDDGRYQPITRLLESDGYEVSKFLARLV